jgi:hypothetical protein
MKVKGRRWKRVRRHGAVRYFLEPLAWAVLIAAAAAMYFFFSDLTGHIGHGRFAHRHFPAQAWANVRLLAGMIFVIALFVFVVYAVICRPRRQTKVLR